MTCFNSNKTGLQPVLRPVEQILGFFPKDFENSVLRPVFHTQDKMAAIGILDKTRISSKFGIQIPDM